MSKRWEAPDDPRFAQTVAVVRDDSFDTWFRWGSYYGLEMDQDTRGGFQQIGEIARRPVCVTVDWYLVGSTKLRVAFIEATSGLVDWDMIEQWEKAVFPAAVARCDGMNFNNAIHDLERHFPDAIFATRDPSVVKAAIAGIPRADQYRQPAPPNFDGLINSLGYEDVERLSVEAATRAALLQKRQ